MRQEVDRLQAGRPAARLTVAFIDLDRFTLINDSLGHGTGDRLLRHLARRLASLAGPARSEEHTSELQSRQYIVCRLLLEKKYQYNIPQHLRSFKEIPI